MLVGSLKGRMHHSAGLENEIIYLLRKMCAREVHDGKAVKKSLSMSCFDMDCGS